MTKTKSNRILGMLAAGPGVSYYVARRDAEPRRCGGGYCRLH